MLKQAEKQVIQPVNRESLLPDERHIDPWESLFRRNELGTNRLTSVEFTVTNLCNLRCEHCAVGDVLTVKESETRIPLSLLLKRLDEVELLDTLSITGGEPMYNKEIIAEYIVPLLRYAKERGAQTQINSNLTLDLSRYESVLPYVDVLHISYNYRDAEDFYHIAYARHMHQVSFAQAEKTFQRLVDNTKALAQAGVFVSAESLLTPFTRDKIGQIHHLIKEMGCQRHEVHPLYPSDFARNMQVLTLDELRETYHRLLDERDPDLWILFGTLPFYACSQNEADLALIKRIYSTPNTTVRNDPDGHNRLNCNIFTGEVTVTDFGDVDPLGHIEQDSLTTCFERWQEHPAFKPMKCCCPQAQCNGPNLLVIHTYYQGVDFRNRHGINLKKSSD
ncbi:radical SAM/CxCxxxxC motif protein YfkAB [Caldalkalibacillus thermarum TA2.A1]|uniref:Radical SAM/CxCxxxxC motif protein YfkAB n=1 Tax=Caldalkalibacillus thermarum (strain TA2.A1) TaxID=986075 RepID=A0A8X8I896_CALTT|nr:radical SAM/CxCxxxxC motif protein YfkAB [Caldalkalibacillus thermarum]QZT33283.1 radical SAM/CxCxxxxC motif protein YfkAB [Caldalkalibacillus thermarum TA2.A1]